MSKTNSNSLSSPIYRFQNSSQPGTYLFAGADEGESILRNYGNFRQEGFAFAVGVSDNDSLMPMYRFQNLVRPGTYLYVGAEERNKINNNPAYRNMFREEGVAFYALDSSTSGGTPFYRFQNTSQPGTYLFVGEQERQSIISNPTLRHFREEGIAFKVSGTLPSGSLSRLPEPTSSGRKRTTSGSEDSLSSSLSSSWVSEATESRRNQVARNIEDNTRKYADLLRSGAGTGGRIVTDHSGWAGWFAMDPMISAAEGFYG